MTPKKTTTTATTATTTTKTNKSKSKSKSNSCYDSPAGVLSGIFAQELLTGSFRHHDNSVALFFHLGTKQTKRNRVRRQGSALQ